MDYLSTSTLLNPTPHAFRRLVCMGCGHCHDVPVYCKDRFCPTCSGPRRARCAKRITALIKATPRKRGYKWRFITLTIPTATDPSARIDTLFDSFKRLRQRSFWKAKVSGGVAVCEVTTNGKTYHVHIHCLVYSAFIPQHTLAKQWKASGPGLICDIRLAPTDAVVGYITKYMTKCELPNEMRTKVSTALKNRRLFSTFGLCHNLKVVVEPTRFECDQCHSSDWMPLDRLDDRFFGRSASP